MTGWGRAGTSVCVSCLTQAHPLTLTPKQHVLQLLGQAECKPVSLTWASQRCEWSGQRSVPLNVTPSSACLPARLLFSCPCALPKSHPFSLVFSLFLIWMFSTFSCQFYPSNFVLLSNQVKKKGGILVAPMHSHPCRLLTWYRLCIETVPAEAVALSVQLSKSPHTLTLTPTYTHTHILHTSVVLSLLLHVPIQQIF